VIVFRNGQRILYALPASANEAIGDGRRIKPFVPLDRHIGGAVGRSSDVLHIDSVLKPRSLHAAISRPPFGVVRSKQH